MLWFNFFPWFKSYFLLFLDMVMHDNEFDTKKIKFKPRIIIKSNTNSCHEEISVLGQLGGKVIS